MDTVKTDGWCKLAWGSWVEQEPAKAKEGK